MSSGGQQLKWNTRERVISPDLNRAQAFKQTQAAEEARRQFTQNQVWEASTPGQLPETVTAPEAGAILQGLFVIAPLGSAELAVAPGMAVFIDPDGQAGSTVPTPANPDDSPAKLCLDAAGVLAGSGTLVLTPNVSGSVRVDVVEIQRDPGIVLESDSRDIFDPSLGTFAPNPVDKVIADKVRYRIRLGTPGAGLPANALGWMPIAVVAVPNLAVTFDPCIIYDVRPLESDRPSPGMRALRLAPEIVRSHYVDSVTVPGQYRMSGRMEGPGVDGYWAGGLYEIDLKNAALREPGFVAVANQIIYLWALYPGGLPRWVRYSAVAVPPFGGRVPLGFRGILCLSQKAPFAAGYAGLNPSLPVALPPDSGFDFGASAFGQLVAATANDTAAGVASRTNCKRGRMQFSATAPGAIIAPAVVPSATFDTVALNYGTHIPYGARAVCVLAQAVFTAAPGTLIQYTTLIQLQHPTAGGPVFTTEYDQVSIVVPGAGFVTVSMTKWVDLITDYSNVTLALLKQVIRVNWDQSTGVKSGEVAVVLGWEL